MRANRLTVGAVVIAAVAGPPAYSVRAAAVGPPAHSFRAPATRPPVHSVRAPANRRAVAPRNLRWHGGPVQRHPRVYIIFWGPRWSTGAVHRAVRTIVVKTIQALRGSSYQHLLTQYYDRAGHITGDVRLAGVWHDRTTPREDFIATKRGVHDAAKEVAHAVAVNGWRNSLDSQYLLLLQSPERTPGPAVYCARNANRSLGGEVFIFSIVPWLGPGGRGCGGHSLGQAYGSTVSHEYAEMVTDPLANAWARGDPAGHNNEIADLCYSDAKVRGVWMQKIWSNRLHGCAA